MAAPACNYTWLIGEQGWEPFPLSNILQHLRVLVAVVVVLVVVVIVVAVLVVVVIVVVVVAALRN